MTRKIFSTFFFDENLRDLKFQQMETIKERLIQIAKLHGLSVRAFEEKCGLGRGNISNMGNASSIGSDKLSKILDTFPAIDIYWILTGEDSPREQKLRDPEPAPAEDSQLIAKLLNQAEEIGKLKEGAANLEAMLTEANATIEHLRKEKNANTIAQGLTQTAPAVAP